MDSPQTASTSPEALLYEYSLLQEKESQFRILRLLPAQQKDAPLACELLIENLDDQDLRPYEAVSYAWGSEEKPCEIHIDGRPFPIGRNLDAALRDFRNLTAPRRLWADAISINQADPSEQGHQVAQMVKIYRAAKCTLAWLGAPYAEDDPRVEAHVTAWRDLAEMWVEDYSGSNRYQQTVELDLQIRRLEHGLSHSPYFTRRWITQELGVAKAVQFCWCGRYIGGAVLGSTVRKMSTTIESLLADEEHPHGPGFLEVLRLETPSLSSSLKEYVWSLPQEDAGGAFLRALDRFDDFKCRDAKDRIAAMNWLAQKPVKYFVDYRNSDRSVYVGFARMMLDHSHESAMQLLFSSASRKPPQTDRAASSWQDSEMQVLIGSASSRLSQADKEALSWPTWAPDWRRSISARPPIIHVRCRLKDFTPLIRRLDPDRKGSSWKAISRLWPQYCGNTLVLPNQRRRSSSKALFTGGRLQSTRRSSTAAVLVEIDSRTRTQRWRQIFNENHIRLNIMFERCKIQAFELHTDDASFEVDDWILLFTDRSVRRQQGEYSVGYPCIVLRPNQKNTALRIVKEMTISVQDIDLPGAEATVEMEID